MSLIGKLNCRIIPAGCIFLRRLIDLSTSARLPHHSITMNHEACHDIAWWLRFLPYSTFCASMRWQSFPATETTLRFFAAYLADQVSFKTIKLYLVGIRFARAENSLPDPFQEAPLLHLLLRGIKHTMGLSSRQQLPSPAPYSSSLQCFLDRCYKRKYTSKSFSVKHLLEKQDRKVFRKVSGIDRHPLRGLLPKKKASTYNLRNRTSQYPKVNTDRFKNSYINRLIFKYNLAM